LYAQTLTSCKTPSPSSCATPNTHLQQLKQLTTIHGSKKSPPAQPLLPASRAHNLNRQQQGNQQFPTRNGLLSVPFNCQQDKKPASYF
jgi:hypothetical protein